MEPGLKRIMTKLQTSVGNGKYYEAHQMYRTLYFRYFNQKKYDNMKTLAYEGSMLLFNVGQNASGVDLASLYVDALIDSKTEPSEEVFNYIANLFEKMQEMFERDVFLSKSLNWSKGDSDEYKTGHPCLHKSIAEIYWKQNNTALARYHYQHSTDGCGYAMMLIELHITQGYEMEIDLFITQVVLHGKLAAFRVLCEKYQACLRRDPLYPEYLEKIAHLFFNVAPTPHENSSNFFGNIIQSLVNSMTQYDSSSAADA